MKTYGWIRGTAPLINLNTKHWWAISLTLRLFYPINPPNSRFGRQESQFGCLQKVKMLCIFRDSNAGSSSLSPVATPTVLYRLQNKKSHVLDGGKLFLWAILVYRNVARKGLQEKFVVCGNWIRHLTIWSPWWNYLPPDLTFTIPMFCPHSACMCFVWTPLNEKI